MEEVQALAESGFPSQGVLFFQGSPKMECFFPFGFPSKPTTKGGSLKKDTASWWFGLVTGDLNLLSGFIWGCGVLLRFC